MESTLFVVHSEPPLPLPPTSLAPSLPPRERLILRIKYPCKKCKCEVLDGEDGIQCDKCDWWIHRKCHNMSQREYDNYTADTSLEFECKECRKCALCMLTIAKNHRKMLCSLCVKYVHVKCNLFNDRDYNDYLESPEDFICKHCISDIFPFSKLNDNQVKLAIFSNNISGEDLSISFTPTEFQTDIFNRLNNIINHNNQNTYDDDLEDRIDLLPMINCAYLNIDEFKAKSYEDNNFFSILHLNIHSVQRHIEEFRSVLSMLNFNFDVICLTESKLIKNIPPTVDILIPNYQNPVGTPTEATKGGVLIYVRNGIHFRPKVSLNIYKSKELESFFIEIINCKGKNQIVGTIYRHPCMNEDLFINAYLGPLSDKLAKVQKDIYIAGDFNFDLLKSDHSSTGEFYEKMMSSFLLPSITKPTKVNRSSTTLIDNIFTNNINPASLSGNLCINLSDGHMPSKEKERKKERKFFPEQCKI